MQLYGEYCVERHAREYAAEIAGSKIEVVVKKREGRILSVYDVKKNTAGFLVTATSTI
ncbi:hypothetical protein SAMN06298226_2795 [Nitrosovibrio sp. Nv4]|nr:hypothetical protein SAMN06298226_2795 [Nitrosovibrio sp. Nv4]